MKKLVIDRTKWQRGSQKPGESRLLSSHGYMCCLGFHALACGKTEEEIRHKTFPGSLFGIGKAGVTVPLEFAPFVEGLVLTNSAFARAMADVNDSRVGCSVHHPVSRAWLVLESESQREEIIREGFKSIGWEVEFIN